MSVQLDLTKYWIFVGAMGPLLVIYGIVTLFNLRSNQTAPSVNSGIRQLRK